MSLQQMGDEQSTTTNIRVVEVENGTPKMEFSFQGTGHLLGANVTDIGTYTGTPRPDGTVLGQGQGVLTTAEGETITWRGTGVGVLSGRGLAVKWHASLIYETASPKFARLTRSPGLAEYDIDEKGVGKAKIFEWT